MEKDVRLTITDDHPIFRAGLVEVIRQAHGFTVVGEAEDGRTGLKMIQSLQPDIAVLDINLPGLSGLEIARTLQQLRIPTRVVILTMYKEESFFEEAVNAGVLGYLLKENAVLELLSCLRAIANGEHYLSPSMSGFLVKRRAGVEELLHKKPALTELTPMEKRVLQMIADNLKTKDIAARLSISTHTVETHRKNICQKLSLHGSQALLRFALENRSKL